MFRFCLAIGFSILLLPQDADGQDVYVNPVIPGDHPDPTLTRIGRDYYTSGSSFNVTPKIYHSTDLVHWRVIAQPVASDWELYGDMPADGVWGGHMVYHHDRYWHFFGRGSGDRSMYFVTADRPEGPWSEPERMRVPRNLPGFGVDNSIFIDDDDRWFLLAKNGRSGNYIVELGSNGQARGDIYDLTWLNPDTEGNPYGWAEGPVMWKHEGFYYYSFAQHLAGTQFVMKSAERDAALSDNPGFWETPRILFEGRQSRFRTPNHSSPAVTAGDGSSWIISHSYDVAEWQALGRQGVLSEIVYDSDGWPKAEYPAGEENAPNLPSSGIPWTVPRSDNFDESDLGPEWSFLGFTPPETYSLSVRPGWLHLVPAGGTSRLPGQNTVIQNAAERAFTLLTRVDFEPGTPFDEAGLWTFNGPESLKAKLFVGFDIGSDGRAVKFSFDETEHAVAILDAGPVWLRVHRDGHDLSGFYSLDGMEWMQVGETIDVTRMDREQPPSESGYEFNAFTGNQQGPYVRGFVPADFDSYAYRDAFSVIPAEYPSNAFGIAGSNRGYLAGINDGDWAMYAGVDFRAGAGSIEAAASSATSGGMIEVRLDSLEGELIGEVAIEATGEWSSYSTFTADVASVGGQRDVYLRFRGSREPFRLASFQFVRNSSTATKSDGPTVKQPNLLQNYPNPFGDGRTTIEFVLSSPSQVVLTVYNLMGQEVTRLVEDYRPAGRHSATFDVGNLPSGLYIYELNANDRSFAKTMILSW